MTPAKAAQTNDAQTKVKRDYSAIMLGVVDNLIRRLVSQSQYCRRRRNGAAMKQQQQQQ